MPIALRVVEKHAARAPHVALRRDPVYLTLSVAAVGGAGFPKEVDNYHSLVPLEMNLEADSMVCFLRPCERGDLVIAV